MENKYSTATTASIKKFASIMNQEVGINSFENTNKREVVVFRQALIVAIKKYTTLAHTRIGEIFGRNHSTISHSLKSWHKYKDAKDEVSLLLRYYYDRVAGRLIEYLNDEREFLEKNTNVNAALSYELEMTRKESNRIHNLYIKACTLQKEAELERDEWKKRHDELASKLGIMNITPEENFELQRLESYR